MSSYDFDILEDRPYCRLHPGRPLILPIYLSSPAFNFVAMSFYDHFCFLQHIRSFPYVSSSAVLPSAEGSLRDALAETCYLYAQNLSTIVTLLLPRAWPGPRTFYTLTQFLVGYHSPTLIRVSRVAVERSRQEHGSSVSLCRTFHPASPGPVVSA